MSMRGREGDGISVVGFHRPNKIFSFDEDTEHRNDGLRVKDRWAQKTELLPTRVPDCF